MKFKEKEKTKGGGTRLAPIFTLHTASKPGPIHFLPRPTKLKLKLCVARPFQARRLQFCYGQIIGIHDALQESGGLVLRN